MLLSSLILSLAAISSLNSAAQIKDYAISRAIDNGASVQLTLAIIQAESGFNPNAKNKSSTASGLAQWLDGSFKYYCIDRYKLTDSMEEKDNPYVQIECLTRRLAESGGYHDWDASRPAWSKYLIMPLEAL